MHIVHVTHRAWPMIGGSERYVQEIARRQVLDGHRVTVVATDAADLAALWDRRSRRVDRHMPDEHQGVRIRRLPTRRLPLGRILFPALRWVTWAVSQLWGRAACPLMRFSPWVPRLRQVLIEESGDLLFAWNITLEGLTAAVVHEARWRGVPWIAIPLLHLGRGRFYTMRHQIDLLREASVVLAQTPGERDFLLTAGFEPDRVRIVSPGVHLDESEEADGDRFREKYGLQGPLVLSLGTLDYDKGTPHLIEAAQRLWQDGRSLTLVLLGPQHESVWRALARLPERQRAFCRYLGLVSEQEKWDAMDAAAVMAMPSRTESFGIVFLEAWACGKPVIGARAGALLDVIRDGVDGLLVDFGDVPALASALDTLLEHPALADELGRRGQEKVRRAYAWEHQYQRLRAIVEGLKDESGPPPGSPGDRPEPTCT